MGGNKFKANTVLAIKLARAVYFMLKNQTAFDPERLVRRPAPNDFGPGRRQPGRLTGDAQSRCPILPEPHTGATEHPLLRVGHACTPAI